MADLVETVEAAAGGRGGPVYAQLQTSGRHHGRTQSGRSMESLSSSGSGASAKMSDVSMDEPEDLAVPLRQAERARPAKEAALPYTSHRSGLVYDVRMRHHAEIQSMQMDEMTAHPEDPKRIFEIFRELEDAGLVSSAEDGSSPTGSDHRLWRIGARQATREEICLVHAPHYYDALQELRHKSEAELYLLGSKLDSIYLHWETFSCAELSTGGAIEACRAVLTGKVKNAIAVIRPPGHHAEHEESRGFCFFNNVAIAARVCQRDFPDVCKKVLIVDWDVHHGNGIQQAFYDDPSVLYISIHLHKDGAFYPSGDYGDHAHCGENAGAGFNVNIPWKKKGMGDGDYLLAFQQIVMPVAASFNPDLVIVASGFDAADGDTLGGCHVSPAGYGHMTHMLKSIAGGKLAVCLEGGYNLRSIAKSALAVTRTLMGEPPDRLGPAEASPAGIATVQLVVATQSRFWTCLYPKYLPVSAKSQVDGDRIHDVVRAWQTKVFWDEFGMSPLFIHRSYVSPSFVNQVVATRNYSDDRPLLLVLHGPPEPIQNHESTSRKAQFHNLWLSDPSKYYIDRAIKLGFAVIDVNIPLHITDPDDDVSGNLEPDGERVRRMATRELLLYLWQNYVQVSESKQVFLMGIGDGYPGMVDLLSIVDGWQDKFVGVVAFLDDTPLEHVKQADNFPTEWYYAVSSIYTSPEHPHWNRDRKRKGGHRYGNLITTNALFLPEMMAEVRKNVVDMFIARTADWRADHVQDDKLLHGAVDTTSAELAAAVDADCKFEDGSNGRVNLDDRYNGNGVYAEDVNPLHTSEAGRLSTLLPDDGIDAKMSEAELSVFDVAAVEL